MENYINKYRNKTFKYLSNTKGFSLEEIKTGEGSIWMCIKKASQGNIAFIFTNSNYINEIDILENVLKAEGRPFNLYNISLGYNEEAINKDCFVDTIVINPENNSIVYANDNNIDIAKFIISINSENNRNISMNKCYVTYGLIIINVLVYILSGIISGNFMDIDSKTLYVLGAKVSYNIYHGEVWRLVTSMFLHADIMHILCNMYSLFAVGSQIEMIFGKARYLTIYFVSGISASILSCIISPNTLSIGASGAIFGLLGAFVVVAYMNRKTISKGIIGNLILVVFINLYIGFTGSNIDNAAHIGGLFAGLIVSSIMFLILKSKNSSKR